MNVSKMHFYARAKVAANKPLTKEDGKTANHDIEFWDYERNSMADGEITDTVDKIETTGEDSSGNKFKASVDSTITMSATWLPFGQDNRLTSPDVRRGEEVMIWQLADDTATFWWTSAERGIDLRKLETVIFGISGTKAEDTPATAENTYFLEMSSHRGAITMHTSNANGEPFTWDFQINAMDGNAVIQSSAGDHIAIDSKETTIEMVNSAGSMIVMNKKKIRMFAEEEISLESNNIKINGKDTIDTQTSTMTSKADTWAIESTTTHTGDFNEIGMLGLSGNMTTAAGGGGTGKIKIGADVEISETVTAHAGANFGGTVKAKKIISDEAISAPNV